MSFSTSFIQNNILSAKSWQNYSFLQHGTFLRSWQPELGKQSIFDRIHYLKTKQGLPDFPVLTGDQVHDDKIIIATKKQNIYSNKGTTDYLTSPYDPSHFEFNKTDALITNIPQQILCIRTADCQPVFFFEPQAKIIALAHCGWKGVFKQLAVKTIQEMLKLNGTLSSIQVWFGPAISSENYEVSEELITQFHDKFPFALPPLPERHLNLNQITAWQLRNIGIQHINFSQECTFANIEKYHSYRRDGLNAGRLLSFMYFIK